MKQALLAVGIGLSLLVFTQFAQAQDDQLPTPKSPYIIPVPDYGHWTVTLKYKSTPAASAGGASTPAAPSAPAAAPTVPQAPAPAAPAAPDSFPTTIDTIKTGDLRGLVLTFGNGTSKQFTCQGNWVLTSTPKGPQLVIVNSGNAPYPYYTTGFIMLDGVKVDSSTFKEAGKRDGIMAFHYKSGDTDVWIDAKTMFPLAAKQAGVDATYQFFNPPPRPFPIPQDQESLLQQERAASQAVRSLR